MGKRELVVLLNLSSWCLVMVVWLFLAVPWVCLWFVIVVFPYHTHYLGLLLQLDITNESQEVSPFPADDHKPSINRRAQKHNKNKTEIT